MPDMRFIGDTPYDLSPSEYKEWLEKKSQQKEERLKYEEECRKEKILQRALHPPTPLITKQREYQSISKNQIVSVDMGEWHDSVMTSRKYWHTIKTPAYVVKIKMIKANPKEAVAVLRLIESREITFALLPYDIGSVIRDVQPHEKHNPDIPPERWNVYRINGYLWSKYEIRLNWLDCFEEIDRFSYMPRY